MVVVTMGVESAMVLIGGDGRGRTPSSGEVNIKSVQGCTLVSVYGWIKHLWEKSLSVDSQKKLYWPAPRTVKEVPLALAMVLFNCTADSRTTVLFYYTWSMRLSSGVDQGQVCGIRRSCALDHQDY